MGGLGGRRGGVVGLGGVQSRARGVEHSQGHIEGGLGRLGARIGGDVQLRPVGSGHVQSAAIA